MTLYQEKPVRLPSKTRTSFPQTIEMFFSYHSKAGGRLRRKRREESDVREPFGGLRYGLVGFNEEVYFERGRAGVSRSSTPVRRGVRTGCRPGAACRGAFVCGGRHGGGPR